MRLRTDHRRSGWRIDRKRGPVVQHRIVLSVCGVEIVRIVAETDPWLCLPPDWDDSYLRISVKFIGFQAAQWSAPIPAQCRGRRAARGEAA